jgi:predicted nucleic acid-binding protein
LIKLLFHAALAPKDEAFELILSIALGRSESSSTFAGLVCQQVMTEATRIVGKRLPNRLAFFEATMRWLNLEIVADAPLDLIADVKQYTTPRDAPIIAAAILAKPFFFATLDPTYLSEPRIVSKKSGLKIVPPLHVVGNQ